MIEVKLSTKDGEVLFSKEFEYQDEAFEWGDEKFSKHGDLVTMIKQEVKRG